MEQILERLDRLEELLIKQASGPLTLAEAARFLGLSKPHLYKLTHQKSCHAQDLGARSYILTLWNLRNGLWGKGSKPMLKLKLRLQIMFPTNQSIHRGCYG